MGSDVATSEADEARKYSILQGPHRGSLLLWCNVCDKWTPLTATAPPWLDDDHLSPGGWVAWVASVHREARERQDEHDCTRARVTWARPRRRARRW